MPGRALMLTGGLATGKTAVAAETVDILAGRGRAVAAIDLDWLGWAAGTTATPDQLIARNLAAVAQTYAAAGVGDLVLARGLVTVSALAGVRDALAEWELAVVLLSAPIAVARRRLAARDAGAELAAHLEQIEPLEARVAAVAVDAPVVENGDRPVREVALEVLRAAGWDD